MGRINKKTEGVFVDIVGSDTEISSYDAFINLKTKTTGSKTLGKYLNEYKKKVNTHKHLFERMAMLEEIIMQLRSKESMDDIKLSLVREYIYARVSFFRKDKTSKDIRVLVDKIEFWLTNPNQEISNENEFISSLEKNDKFMNKAVYMLTDAMELEINDNIDNYEEIKKISLTRKTEEEPIQEDLES